MVSHILEGHEQTQTCPVHVSALLICFTVTCAYSCNDIFHVSIWSRKEFVIFLPLQCPSGKKEDHYFQGLRDFVLHSLPCINLVHRTLWRQLPFKITCHAVTVTELLNQGFHVCNYGVTCWIRRAKISLEAFTSSMWCCR